MLYLMKSKSYHLLVEGYGEMSWIEKKKRWNWCAAEKVQEDNEKDSRVRWRDRLRQHCWRAKVERKTVEGDGGEEKKPKQCLFWYSRTGESRGDRERERRTAGRHSDFVIQQIHKVSWYAGSHCLFRCVCTPAYAEITMHLTWNVSGVYF